MVAAYGAVQQALQGGSAGAMAELQGVRGDVIHLRADALPELVQQLRTLTAKVAALEGSTLSAGATLSRLNHYTLSHLSQGVAVHLRADALPELVQQLRALTAKVAALEGSALSAGVPLWSLKIPFVTFFHHISSYRIS